MAKFQITVKRISEVAIEIEADSQAEAEELVDEHAYAYDEIATTPIVWEVREDETREVELVR